MEQGVLLLIQLLLQMQLIKLCSKIFSSYSSKSCAYLLRLSISRQFMTVVGTTPGLTSGTGFINIFVVSTNKVTPCLTPTAVTVGFCNSYLGCSCSSTYQHDIYYTSSTVATNSSRAATVSGITGLTTNITSGITSTTKYHVWIKSNCGGSVGEQASGTTFTTLCSTFNVPYTENFDNTSLESTSNTHAPIYYFYFSKDFDLIKTFIFKFVKN